MFCFRRPQEGSLMSRRIQDNSLRGFRSSSSSLKGDLNTEQPFRLQSSKSIQIIFPICVIFFWKRFADDNDDVWCPIDFLHGLSSFTCQFVPDCLNVLYSHHHHYHHQKHTYRVILLTAPPPPLQYRNDKNANEPTRPAVPSSWLMWPWRVKMPTENLLRLLLLLMLVMRIVLARVCCRFGSWGLVTGWQDLAGFRGVQKWPWNLSSSAYLQFSRQMRRFCA